MKNLIIAVTTLAIVVPALFARNLRVLPTAEFNRDQREERIEATSEIHSLSELESILVVLIRETEENSDEKVAKIQKLTDVYIETMAEILDTE